MGGWGADCQKDYPPLPHTTSFCPNNYYLDCINCANRCTQNAWKQVGVIWSSPQEHTKKHTRAQSNTRGFGVRVPPFFFLMLTAVPTRAATVPVSPGWAARRCHRTAGLHQSRTAAAGTEGRWDPSGAGGHHPTEAAAHSTPGPPWLSGPPSSFHAHS